MGAFNFRLGPFPVRVHFFFLLTALLLGSMGGSGSPSLLAAWVGTMFVSVLLHELGHAVAGRAYGLTPVIELHGMGGTTSWTASKRQQLGHGAGLVISFAGPLVGIVVGAIAVGVLMSQGASGGDVWNMFLGRDRSELGQLAHIVLFINLGWSAFNLMPVLPLDGGQIMAHLVGVMTRDRAPRLPHFLSIAFAGVLALFALTTQWLFLGILAALYIYRNVQALQAFGAMVEETPRFEELAEGFAAIKAGDGHKAIRIAESVLGNTGIAEMRHGAIKLLAYGRLLEGQWGQLMALLESARRELGHDELQRFEQAARELDRGDEAAQIRRWLDGASPTAPLPFRA